MGISINNRYLFSIFPFFQLRKTSCHSFLFLYRKLWFFLFPSAFCNQCCFFFSGLCLFEVWQKVIELYLPRSWLTANRQTACFTAWHNFKAMLCYNQGCGSGYFSNASASASTNKKRPLTIFFNFYGSVACLLLHFIILRRQKPSFIAITLPTSLELIAFNYSVFVFLRYQNSCWM